jgi:hypothetical protein
LSNFFGKNRVDDAQNTTNKELRHKSHNEMGQVGWPGLGLPGLINPILFSKLFFSILKQLMFFYVFSLQIIIYIYI